MMQDKPKSLSARLDYIDFLKVVGLTGIIIAHVGSPRWVHMLRNFDVPLLVIISSLLAEKSYKKYEGNGLKSAGQYFLSRFQRLVLPTWIFLTLYFLLSAFHDRSLQNLEYYFCSYCMTRYGISYVWIILIYLYSALLIPFFCKLKFSLWSVVFIAVIYLSYETACFFQIGTANKVFETTFYYIIPYGLLTYMGYNYYKMPPKIHYWIMIVSFTVFVLLAGYYWIKTGSLQSVQIAKYPPTSYYLSYGVLWSFSLLLFCEKFSFKLYTHPLIKYISIHSLWIYLWHILVLYYYDMSPLPQTWFLKLILVFSFALLLVFAVNTVLDLLEKKRTIRVFKYLRG